MPIIILYESNEDDKTLTISEGSFEFHVTVATAGANSKGSSMYYRNYVWETFWPPSHPFSDYVQLITFSTERNQELTQSFTEEKKGLDFSPRSGEATSGEK